MTKTTIPHRTSSSATLPDYLSKAVPNPAANRAPWYKNIAPSYAGVFLWIAFYNSIAVGTITRGTIAVCLLALAAAGFLSYALYYYVPAMLGMKTGHPLYVVGSSTFGTRGGYLMPGLLMGLLQVGWLAVGTFFATKFLLSGFGVPAGPGTMAFIVVGVIWGYVMAWIGVMGIKYDFGTFSRDRRDVRWGGIVGIVVAVMVAGGLPLLSVAGAKVLMPSVVGFNYDAVVAAIGGPLARAMFFLFALACIPPACFSSFIVGNSFSTMIPGTSRMGSTMAGMTIAIVLAVTGVAENLVGFFTIVGASFGPICGAMAADYLLSGRKWAGPRRGINWAGYASWAVGFFIGILPFLPVGQQMKELSQPAVVYSFIAGFAVYMALAKAGLQPETETMPASL